MLGHYVIWWIVFRLLEGGLHMTLVQDWSLTRGRCAMGMDAFLARYIFLGEWMGGCMWSVCQQGTLLPVRWVLLWWCQTSFIGGICCMVGAISCTRISLTFLWSRSSDFGMILKWMHFPWILHLTFCYTGESGPMGQGSVWQVVMQVRFIIPVFSSQLFRLVLVGMSCCPG